MADFFVDKLLHNEEVLQKWKQLTKDFIKVDGFKKMLNEFLKISEDVNEEIYRKNNYKIPKHFFKGDSGVKITDIANQFGIKPLNRKLRLCPFHEDKNNSLSFSDEKGVFNCFGCGKKGNIITFYAMLKKIKRENGT